MMTILHYVWLPLAVMAYVGFWCAVAHYFLGPWGTPLGLGSIPITLLLILFAQLGAAVSKG